MSLQGFRIFLIDLLQICLAFYAVSALFQPYTAVFIYILFNLYL